ncbi:hypothetical protein C8Q70DRAFT_935983 [Cubamyces menziesii]|uniref:Uncharacterized protein n=1 Tax=Trametes cubensis TaxID=1111947 RepID=A0AAD7TJB9_9APHY|nr:hypothetical protein C8Q70DRAFT_935983 [Cubamyces menziesii]KAJ8457666.1 hypothetical protein ONZ51_g11390 [Trametes cubensis]
MSSPPANYLDSADKDIDAVVEGSGISTSAALCQDLRKSTGSMGNPTNIEHNRKSTTTRAQRARKKSLFQARRAVVLSVGLDRHKILFDQLAALNMSGDETDHDTWHESPVKYRIIESHWQSEDLKTFMRSLDEMYCNNQSQCTTDANSLHTRIARVNARVEDGHAPRGLWRNCYNADWLRKLPSYKKHALKIKNADYDFDLTPLFDELEDAIMQEQEHRSADEVEEVL